MSEQQKRRLAELTAEVEYDRITISFSLDVREPMGSKKSSFYSATVNRRGVGESHKTSGGWTSEEVKVVRALLSKHVVAACYDDAIRRRMMTSMQAREEVMPILAAYDAHIVKNLTNWSE